MGAVKVSVVIAARNESRYVEEAVRSVIAQAGLPFEIIFVEDWSDDDTFEIASGLARANENLVLMRNPGRGKVSAFNAGVAAAKGDWVCLFAGDDVMPPGALAARVGAVEGVFSDRPVLGLCRLVTMSENPKNDGHHIPRAEDKGAYSGACYLFSREALAVIWPIPEDLPNEDTWLEVAALHLDICVVHSGVVGLKWRLHAGNSINFLMTFDEFNRRFTPRMAAAQRFLRVHGDLLSPARRAALEARVACENARRSGDLVGILRSGVGIVDKARALSLSNPSLYAVRARLYGLFSGW